jgi:uncharacterized protein with NRDE domain
VLAGQDLSGGGTWLGVSEEGRLAVVTNLRGYGSPETGRPSRGLLLRDLLAGEGAYARPGDEDLDRFNPFNLFTLMDGALVFWSNRPQSERRRLGPGLYGASNGPLDAPWPKTLRLKAALAGWLEEGGARPEVLLGALRDDQPPPAQAGPPSDAPEPPQTAIFIRDPLYGTRCSTVVAIDRDGRGMIVERRYDAAGAATGETALDFGWPW